MTGIRRVRQSVLLVGVFALLVGLGAGVGHPRATNRLEGQSAVLSASTLVGSGPAGAPDTRFQRDVAFGERHVGSRLDGLAASLAQAQASRARIVALAAVVEWAGHPERIGHILLRGPPTASA
jgi:hypothetical protein